MFPSSSCCRRLVAHDCNRRPGPDRSGGPAQAAEGAVVTSDQFQGSGGGHGVRKATGEAEIPPSPRPPPSRERKAPCLTGAMTPRPTLIALPLGTSAGAPSRDQGDVEPPTSGRAATVRSKLSLFPAVVSPSHGRARDGTPLQRWAGGAGSGPPRWSPVRVLRSRSAESSAWWRAASNRRARSSAG